MNIPSPLGGEGRVRGLVFLVLLSLVFSPAAARAQELDQVVAGIEAT